MEKMKAIIVSENKDLLWSEAKKPKILDHEVLIKIKATAVNRADVVQKNGFYPPPPGASEILGLECSGVIEAIGKNVKKEKSWRKSMCSFSWWGICSICVMPGTTSSSCP
jgi:NADPH:quinone reductase-like Zn-dependent oxidoreductase